METAHVYILHRKAFTSIVDLAIGLMMMMMMIAQESRAFCCCQSLQGRLPYNPDDCFIYTLNRSSYALQLKKEQFVELRTEFVLSINAHYIK